MNSFFLERREIEWARNNSAYLLDRGIDFKKDPSVCHGLSGNAASLLAVYRVAREPQYQAAIHKAVELLESTAEEDAVGIYWDSEDYKIDYSYMTGMAGIGDFFILMYTGGRLNMMDGLGYGADF